MRSGEDLMVAVGYGDAFGLPFETADYDPERCVNWLLPVEQNKYLGKLPLGTWSDDTHLSLATALALARRREFDLEYIAENHVRALDLTNEPEEVHRMLAPAFTTSGKRRGWGKGTTMAVEKLRDGVSPADSGSPDRHGNGVLMKMAPLVHWQLISQAEIIAMVGQVAQFANMTHANTYSIINAQKYADILTYLAFHEELYGSLGGTQRSDEELLAMTPGRGFTAWETLEVALYYFRQEPRFPQNIHLAVRYGGDADSICSILGAMSVFAGTYTEPVDAKDLHDYWRLRYVGKLLDDSVSVLWR